MKKQFSKSTQGGFYLVMVSLSLITILIVCGLAVDSANLFLAQLRLQRIIDAGTLSGLKLLNKKPDSYVIRATKQLVSDSLEIYNYTIVDDVDVVVSAQGIDVSASIDVPLYLMSLLPGFSHSNLVSSNASAGLPPTIIELVLDITHSMTAKIPCNNSDPNTLCVKKDLLIEATKEFIDGLDDSGKDYLGISAYSSFAKIAISPHVVTSEFKTAAKNAVESLRFSGATCISCGLQKGLEQIQKVESTTTFRIPPNKFLVLFTDGVPNIPYSQRNSDSRVYEDCWNGNNTEQWGIYSNEIETTHVQHSTNVTNPTDATTMWETIHVANKIALSGITTYVIGLGKARWSDGFVTGCRDSSSDSPCPKYLENLDSQYTDANGDPVLGNNDEPLYGVCPLERPQISDNGYGATILPTEVDPFEGCEYGFRSILLRRLANDPIRDSLRNGNFPDPVFPYRKDIPGAEDLAPSDYATEDTAWKRDYWESCTHRVGPRYPEGEALETPSPDELPEIFQRVLEKIKSHARLVPWNS